MVWQQLLDVLGVQEGAALTLRVALDCEFAEAGHVVHNDGVSAA
jgi:hypothetical protein